jgi:ATP-dependent RNA helicase DOB1
VARINECKIAKDPKLNEIYELYNTKTDLDLKIKSVKELISQAESVLQLNELKCRRRVLRRMGYVSESDVIEMKGRVACEISSGDELLLTEMVFNGIFNDLTVEQTVALLSCFTFDERRDDPPPLRAELSGPFKLMQESARRIAKVSNECKIELDEESYIESFRSELMEVVFAW